MVKSRDRKTTAVAYSQTFLGAIAFSLWTFRKIDYVELGASIAFISWLGGIVGNLFAKDSNNLDPKGEEVEELKEVKETKSKLAGRRRSRTIDRDRVGGSERG